MVASTGSLLVGSVFGILAVIGLVLNTVVILTIYKGRLLGPKASPVYILSTQTMLMDILMFLVHLLYQTPSVMWQTDLFSPLTDAICDFLLMYCWFHNSLSHILIALNRISFSWVFYSYAYMLVVTCLEHCIIFCVFFQQDVPNYSAMGTIPLEAASSLISMLSYATIVWSMHKSRVATLQLGMERKRRYQEYSYAIQFATMVMVYSLVWIFFNTFPLLIGETKFVYIYGLTTVLVLFNAFANAVVYLYNNREIQSSIRVMFGLTTNVASMNVSKTENA